MEHLDKLLPITILLAVAAVLLILLRRAVRERTALLSQVVEAVKPAPVESLVSPATVAAPRVAPNLDEERGLTLAAIGQLPAIMPKQKRKPNVPAPSVAPERTTIGTVLNLLNEKDSLATAFLLREIFAPPLSRRSKRDP